MTPNSNSNSNSDNNINRGGADGLEMFARENCLMLLATKAAAIAEAAIAKQEVVSGEDDDEAECLYPCKTCGRTFKSFQALGGHRASHVKPKSAVDDGSDVSSSAETLKPKTFQCSTCGAEYRTGQALGGHMRRHRSLIPADSSTISSVTTEEDGNGIRNIKKEIKKRKIDVLKNLSSSNKRVCLELTLGYAPLVPEKEQEHADEIEEGEIVEQEEKEDDNYDWLKLELRQPIRD